LQEIPEDQCLRKQWNALVQEMECPEVFYTYEWAMAVQRAYRRSLSPLLILGYEGDCLRGVAALAADLTQGDTVAFLAGTTADYCDLLSSPGYRAEWFDAVLSTLHSRGYRRLALANLPGDSASAPALSKACSRYGYQLLLRPAYSCARLILGREDHRQSLKRKTNSKKIRRYLNIMGKEGPVSVCHHRTWEEIKPILPDFCAAHVARFVAAGLVSNLAHSERRAFVEELARELSSSGWLRLSRLLVGNTCVAWNYGFQFSGSWFWYLPTFDTKYELFSPGFCLLSKIVETACDAPSLQVVDLGLGTEEYKNRFATEARQTLHATLDASFLKHARSVVRYRSAAMIKALPFAEDTWRKIAREVRKFRFQS
jgi:CelD/BcsL family acetyltransferase involved in cellulose biosynthesis